MKIEEYIKLDSEERISSFLDEISGFHDSLIKEVHIVNSAFVDKDKSMIMDFEYNARLLLQSQFNPIGIELILVDIRKIKFEKLFEIYSGNIKAIKENEELMSVTFDTEFQLECRDIFYKTKDEYFGNKIFLDGQVPGEDVVICNKIKENWRQCENCCEAWEMNEEVEICACPRCNKLTELKSTSNNDR